MVIPGQAQRDPGMLRGKFEAGVSRRLKRKDVDGSPNSG
jgi:hypothetical protein